MTYDYRKIVASHPNPMHGINHAIDCGVTSHGIGYEELDRDLQTLLDGGYTTPEELRQICKNIEAADKAVHELYLSIEKFMPHRNIGNSALGVVGNNKILSFFIDIGCSNWDFRGGMRAVRIRVEKILVGKEQQQLF